MCKIVYVFIAGTALMGLAAGCGNSDGETEADRVGVGAECTVDPSADPPSTCPVVDDGHPARVPDAIHGWVLRPTGLWG